MVLERGQQEWHERYSRAFDDLEHMQTSLRRQQHNQQQQDLQQQQLMNEHSQHMLAAIQSKLAGFTALFSKPFCFFVLYFSLFIFIVQI